MQTSPSAPHSPLIDGLGEAVLLALTDADYVTTRGPHRHPHGELFLLRSGYLKSETAAGRWLIPAGHLCWVPPFAVHGAVTDGTRGVRIYLAPELCGELLRNEPCIISSTPLILAVIDRLAVFSRPHASLAGAEGRLISVLRDEIGRGTTKPIALPMPQDPRLSKPAERWLQDPVDPRNLDELASEAGMSRRSFTRKFKLDTGVPVGEWRQVARLIHGIAMLAAGRTVTETAFALGYDSISSFVVLCRRHTGMSPKTLARSLAAA